MVTNSKANTEPTQSLTLYTCNVGFMRRELAEAPQKERFLSPLEQRPHEESEQRPSIAPSTSPWQPPSQWTWVEVQFGKTIHKLTWKRKYKPITCISY